MVSASPEVQTSLTAVTVAQLEVTKLANALERAKKVLEEYQERLARQLATGGTTGDWLRDQCIKAWGLDPAAEAACREVHDSLAGHKGEFVLLAYEQKKCLVREWLLDDRYTVVTYYRLGVLTDDRMVLVSPQYPAKRPSLGVPVHRFIEGTKESFDPTGTITVVEHGIFDRWCPDRDPPSFGQYILNKADLSTQHPVPLALPHRPTSAELVVGNKAVKTWLKAAGMEDLYEPAAHALGMLEHEPTDAT